MKWNYISFAEDKIRAILVRLKAAVLHSGALNCSGCYPAKTNVALVEVFKLVN
jgi:hypothetical protein